MAITPNRLKSQSFIKISRLVIEDIDQKTLNDSHIKKPISTMLVGLYNNPVN
jgi:hypothetical protein